MFYPNEGLILHTNSIDSKVHFSMKQWYIPLELQGVIEHFFSHFSEGNGVQGLTKADDRLL